MPHRLVLRLLAPALAPALSASRRAATGEEARAGRLRQLEVSRVHLEPLDDARPREAVAASRRSMDETSGAVPESSIHLVERHRVEIEALHA